MSTRLGLVRCEHCGRQFNAHSAARHIPWCAKQQSNSRKHQLSAEKRLALERYKWRISYRPSNQMGANSEAAFQRHQQQQQQNRQRVDGKLRLDQSLAKLTKKSSINSSSMSASSTASSGSFARQPASSRQVGNAARPRSPPASSSNLKRSISSLTLTKQAGISQHQRPSANSKPWPLPTHEGESSRQQRTKSVSDLQNMSDIVDTLAKKMDQIYTQNQLLLARMALDGKRGHQNDSDSLDSNGLLASDGDQRCHHCRASCLETANYCHRCGCKVRAASEASSCASPG